MAYSSITTTCISASNAVAKTWLGLKFLVRDVPGARPDVNLLSVELHALDGVLDLLKGHAACFPPPLACRTPGLLGRCAALLRELEGRVAAVNYDELKVEQKAVCWAASRAEIWQYRFTLAAYKATLGVALDLLALAYFSGPSEKTIHEDPKLGRLLREIEYLQARLVREMASNEASDELHAYVDTLLVLVREAAAQQRQKQQQKGPGTPDSAIDVDDGKPYQFSPRSKTSGEELPPLPPLPPSAESQSKNPGTPDSGIGLNDGEPYRFSPPRMAPSLDLSLDEIHGFPVLGQVPPPSRARTPPLMRPVSAWSNSTESSCASSVYSTQMEPESSCPTSPSAPSCNGTGPSGDCPPPRHRMMSTVTCTSVWSDSTDESSGVVRPGTVTRPGVDADRDGVAMSTPAPTGRRWSRCQSFMRLFRSMPEEGDGGDRRRPVSATVSPSVNVVRWRSGILSAGFLPWRRVVWTPPPASEPASPELRLHDDDADDDDDDDDAAAAAAVDSAPLSPLTPSSAPPPPGAIFDVSLRKSMAVARASATTHHAASSSTSRRHFPLCVLTCANFIRLASDSVSTRDLFVAGACDPAGLCALERAFSRAPAYGRDMHLIPGPDGATTVVDGVAVGAYEAAGLLVLFLSRLPTALVPEATARSWAALAMQSRLGMARAPTRRGSMGLRGVDGGFWEQAMRGLAKDARGLVKLLLTLWGDVAEATAERTGCAITVAAERLAEALVGPLMHVGPGSGTKRQVEEEYRVGVAFMIRRGGEYSALLRGRAL